MKRFLALLMVCILLLSAAATALADTSIDLIKPTDECYGTWKRVSTRRYSFQFEVKNTSSYKTVRSFDVTYYTTDGYGVQNCATTTITLTQKIKPYERVYTNEFYLENAEDVCKVYTAVTGVRYTNGTTQYVDEPSYTYWIINEDILMVEPDTLSSATESTSSSSSSSSSTSALDRLREKLNSSSAPMKIVTEGDAIFKQVSTKRISMQFDVRNNSTSKTVRSYDVTYYTCDEWGAQNSAKQTVTLTQKIKPYETIMSSIIYLENQSSVYQINAAITRVRYTDGTTQTISSPEYITWNLER